MIDTAGFAPEVSRTNGNVYTILNSDPASLQQHAPLLNGVRMDRAFAVRGEVKDRQDGLFSKKHPGFDTFSQGERDSLAKVGKTEKWVRAIQGILRLQ